MITSIIRFTVFPDKERVLPMVWGAQKRMLNEAPGFVHAQLAKDLTKANSYIIQTHWESLDALEAWKAEASARGGEHMQRMLRGESVMVNPPYEVTRYDVLYRSDDPEEDAGD